MVFNFLNILMLLAVVQGLLLTAFIFKKYRKLFANRFLGALIATYSIVLVYLLLDDLGLLKKYSFAIVFLVGFGLLASALNYLYVKYMVDKKAAFAKKNWLHFLPFALFEFYSFISLFIFHNKQMAFFPLQEESTLPTGFVIFNWTILIQSTIYMILSVRLLNRYARYIKDVFSSIDRITLKWLRNITYLVIFVLFIYMIENILLLWGIHVSYQFSLSCSLMAICVFIIGYLGLYKSEIFALPKIAESISQLSEMSYQSQLDKEKNNPKSEKYEKSGLAKEKAMIYLDDLLKIMEEKKPFINPDLTLNQLAEMLSMTPHNLSEVLNTQLCQNFFDFINKYRVEKVKNDLSDPEKKNIKLLSIALDAGFNSKSTFNAIFKKYTHVTPSEYRQYATGK